MTDGDGKPVEDAGSQPERETAGGATEQASPGADAGLEAELTKVQSELADIRERMLRVAADAENSRRRAEQDVQQARKFALERFALELLPVRDNLERALRAERGEDPERVEALFAGVDLTLKLMDSVFEKFAITVVDPVGMRFDPERHQAMTMVENAEVPANHVVEVVQKGFLLNDRLLRPALVMVAKPPNPQP